MLDGALSSYPDTGDDMGLPAQDEVVRKTERITKRIQELLVSAQQNKYEKWVFYFSNSKGDDNLVPL